MKRRQMVRRWCRPEQWMCYAVLPPVSDLGPQACEIRPMDAIHIQKIVASLFSVRLPA